MSGEIKAVVQKGIVKGHCVVVDDNGEVVYGGPIRDAPNNVQNLLVMLHAEDYARLEAVVKRRRH